MSDVSRLWESKRVCDMCKSVSFLCAFKPPRSGPPEAARRLRRLPVTTIRRFPRGFTEILQRFSTGFSKCHTLGYPLRMSWSPPPWSPCIPLPSISRCVFSNQIELKDVGMYKKDQFWSQWVFSGYSTREWTQYAVWSREGRVEKFSSCATTSVSTIVHRGPPEFPGNFLRKKPRHAP